MRNPFYGFGILAILLALSTTAIAQGGPPGGGGGGNSLQTTVETLQQQVAALESRMTAAEAALNAETAARIAADQALQQATQLIQALQPFISVDLNPINGLTGPHIIFSGANIHVRNGGGFTSQDDGGVLNGLGNLIVGYNEEFQSLRTGSHNLVVGPY